MLRSNIIDIELKSSIILYLCANLYDYYKTNDNRKTEQGSTAVFGNLSNMENVDLIQLRWWQFWQRI